MENMWQFNIEDSGQESPKNILEEQAKLLPKLTGDMVYATVVEDIGIGFDHDFQNVFMYSLLIKSKFLPNYGFRVLTISHNIPFYPAQIRLDSDISNEIGINSSLEVHDEVPFKSILRDTLRSKRIGSVINSIIKLSK